MTLADKLRDRVAIQVRTITQTALGQIEVWKFVERRFAQVIPLDAKARAIYQQLKSEVSHKVVFRGSVTLNLGSHRILHGSKTYEPVEPPQIIENSTVVVCKEV